MKTIIHDLDKKSLELVKIQDSDKLIDATKCVNGCKGCFSCWIKHPKRCAIKDEYSNLVNYLSKSDELILISKNRYGCYSSEVKRVLERCIGYVLPYFTIRKGRIHHKSRYQNKLKLKVYTYGNISETEKKNFDDLVNANCINLNASENEVIYLKNVKEIKNVNFN